MQMQEHEIDVTLKDAESEKRRKENKLFEINVLTIGILFCLLSLFLIFGKRPTYSAEEKRDLAKCPKFTIEAYLDGSFTENFAAFFNDSVPLRSVFKGWISDFRGHLGIPYEDGTLIGNIPTIESSRPAKPEETEPPTTDAPVPVVKPSEAEMLTEASTEETIAPTEAETEDDYEDADGEMTNNILIVKHRGIMLYGGNYEQGESYARTLNTYKEKLGPDVNVYSMVAPTAVSFYLPKKFQNASASEKDHIDHINSCLSGVIPVDAYSLLEEHKSEAIYSRTDHHWQPLGAYYAAQAFAEEAGVPFAPLSDYETVVLEGYVGTLYGYTGSADIKDNPEDFIYYKPQNSYTTTYYDIDMTNEREGALLLSSLDHLDVSDWYLVFMGGDERVTHVETDCKNGRTLCIIKDSYGNALVPCLTNSFEEIWVIDMRFFTPNIIDFMQEKGVTDVLFAMNTFSATGTNSDDLQTLLNQ